MNREDYIAKAPTFTIYDGFCKTKSVLENHSRIIVSGSGGSDSDDMVDIAEHLKPDDGCELIYVWFDTGIEMAATKRHRKYLQERYGIEIHTESGHKKVAAAVRSDGYPFMNKVVSEYIDRLQTHDFQWEDKPFDVLCQEYPNCKAALRWWCNNWKSEPHKPLPCNDDIASIARNVDDQTLREMEDVVKEWNEKHPAKTRKEVFLQEFPNAFLQDDTISICPKCLDKDYEPNGGCASTGCGGCRFDYWSKEVWE